MKVIILAGGIGTRLWPMSRMAKPKQFYPVITDEPLIKDIYQRLLKGFSEDQIYFSITQNVYQLIRENFPNVKDDHILIEPSKRDTGPAMGWVAARLALIDPDESMVFVPSDHYIKNEEVFLHCLKAGGELVQETGKLLDIGITPEFPSTALGYIKIGQKIENDKDIELYEFIEHKEKPNYDLAKFYLEDGRYLWHANYYMWTPRGFMDAFNQYEPQVGEKLLLMQKAWQVDDQETVLNLYNLLPKKSIDYLITEKIKAGEMLVIKGDFGWSDVGAWDTLHDQLKQGENNVAKGACVAIDTKNSLIYGESDKLIAVIGLEDVMVVDTEDALLVCRKEQAQRVKDIVNRLKEEGYKKYL